MHSVDIVSTMMASTNAQISTAGSISHTIVNKGKPSVMSGLLTFLTLLYPYQ